MDAAAGDQWQAQGRPVTCVRAPAAKPLQTSAAQGDSPSPPCPPRSELFLSPLMDCGTSHIFLMFGCLRLQTRVDLIEPRGRRPQRVGVCPDPPAGRGVGRGLQENRWSLALGSGFSCGSFLTVVRNTSITQTNILPRDCLRGKEPVYLKQDDLEIVTDVCSPQGTGARCGRGPSGSDHVLSLGPPSVGAHRRRWAGRSLRGHVHAGG